MRPETQAVVSVVCYLGPSSRTLVLEVFFIFVFVFFSSSKAGTQLTGIWLSMASSYRGFFWVVLLLEVKLVPGLHLQMKHQFFRQMSM